MSYDIRWCLETVCENKDGEHFVVYHIPNCDSPTYNYRKMFVACMDWDYHQIEVDDDGNWHAAYYPMSEVLPKLQRGLKELTEHPERYRQYEPENKWGTLEGAVKCFNSWIGELTNEDDWDFIGHKWPIETLWWRW